jgi:hypothetical protein
LLNEYVKKEFLSSTEIPNVERLKEQQHDSIAVVVLSPGLFERRRSEKNTYILLLLNKI